MDSGSTAQRLPVLNRVALERYIDDLLADIRKPLPSSNRSLNVEQPENITESAFRTISGRPAPVFVGVSE